MLLLLSSLQLIDLKLEVINVFRLSDSWLLAFHEILELLLIKDHSSFILRFHLLLRHDMYCRLFLLNYWYK